MRTADSELPMRRQQPQRRLSAVWSSSAALEATGDEVQQPGFTVYMILPRATSA